MVTPSFSWNQFQNNRSQPVPEPNPKENSISGPEKDFSWGGFQNTSTYQGEADPASNESTFGSLTRNAVSHGLRYAEGFLGRYGDAKQFVENFFSKNPKSLGLLGSSLHSLMGQEGWENMWKGSEGNPSNIKIPTSRDLRDVTESLTGDYTKPKGKAEKYMQELASDYGSLGTRLLNRTGVGRRGPLVNNFGIPAAATAAKAAVEELGFGEDKGTWSKLASWTALSLLNNVNGRHFAANLMNEGRQAFGPHVSADIPRYTNRVNGVARNMLQGDPRSQLAQQQIAGINNDIQNGQNTMRDLMNRYDAINAAKRDRGLFGLNSTDRAAAVRNINQVRDVVRHEIEAIGAHNPQGLQAWQNGVQAFAVINQSERFSNLAQRWMEGPTSKTIAAGLFGKAALSEPALVGSAAVATGSAHKAGQIAYRVWNDPNLAHYYWESVNALREGNQSAFLKNINSLNKGYEKKYGKEHEEGTIGAKRQSLLKKYSQDKNSSVAKMD
jgi:hypothetical protein